MLTFETIRLLQWYEIIVNIAQFNSIGCIKTDLTHLFCTPYSYKRRLRIYYVALYAYASLTKFTPEFSTLVQGISSLYVIFSVNNSHPYVIYIRFVVGYNTRNAYCKYFIQIAPSLLRSTTIFIVNKFHISLYKYYLH